MIVREIYTKLLNHYGKPLRPCGFYNAKAKCIKALTA